MLPAGAAHRMYFSHLGRQWVDLRDDVHEGFKVDNSQHGLRGELSSHLAQLGGKAFGNPIQLIHEHSDLPSCRPKRLQMAHDAAQSIQCLTRRELSIAHPLRRPPPEIIKRFPCRFDPIAEPWWW